MIRFRKARLTAAAALVAAWCATAFARADTGTNLTVAVQNPPVVRVQMRAGSVSIHTWDRSEVQVTSSDPVAMNYFGPDAVQGALRSGDIPIFSTKVVTPDGEIALPFEDFSVPSLTTGTHDGVVIFAGNPGADVSVTVPSSTALVWTLVGRGQLSIENYHGGAFVARVHNGSVSLSNVSGDGFVEAARGSIAIENSTFNRLRTRSAIGNIVFRNCNARQIEVSSLNGNIAFDNGTFVPGLARFETMNGDLAVGIAGGSVSVGAHAAAGRVYTNFARGADVRGAANDAQAIVNGGGPVVTAVSQRGDVYLYDGSFTSRPALQREWKPVGRIFKVKICAKRPCRV